MLVTISTGVKIANMYPAEFSATVFTVTVPDIEISPDAVFHAANRIDEDEVDIANLETDWQQDIRRALDTARAPSMSSGDAIELIAANGTYLGGWRCEPIGWSKIEVVP